MYVLTLIRPHLLVVLLLILLALFHIVVDHRMHLSPGPLTCLDPCKARCSFRIIFGRCHSVGLGGLGSLRLAWPGTLLRLWRCWGWLLLLGWRLLLLVLRLLPAAIAGNTKAASVLCESGTGTAMGIVELLLLLLGGLSRESGVRALTRAPST